MHCDNVADILDCISCTFKISPACASCFIRGSKYSLEKETSSTAAKRVKMFLVVLETIAS